MKCFGFLGEGFEVTLIYEKNIEPSANS